LPFPFPLHFHVDFSPEPFVYVYFIEHVFVNGNVNVYVYVYVIGNEYGNDTRAADPCHLSRVTCHFFPPASNQKTLPDDSHPSPHCLSLSNA
jgi:hypothetical protein